jgi:DHA1 family bicyclomycin/chloramphenicol resistance-like MFS transporter
MSASDAASAAAAPAIHAPPIHAPSTHAPSTHAPLSTGGFVALLAALMAMNALAIDVMLPALPQIGADLGLGDPNQRQAVVTSYLLGFGLGQLMVGPLSDSVGRRPVLLAGLVAYTAAGLWCVMAQDFQWLLIARAAQGFGSAAPRVIVTALARDCYAGRQMARIMSLVMMCFMAAPVLAPSIGQAILLAAEWRAIFAALVLYGLVVFWVVATRLPETLAPQRRRALTLRAFGGGLAMVLGSRQTVGYTLASGVFFGALFGFIGSAQQILGELYGLGALFPVVFGGIAVAIAAAAFVNSQLVERLGMRALSHGAIVGFTVIAAALTVVASGGRPPLWLFVGMLATAMMLAGLIFSNVNALAMEPQAAVAGLASSLLGGFTTLIGAGLGWVIGNAYDGTVLPLAVGYTACGGGALALILLTERGRLFRAGAR